MYSSLRATLSRVQVLREEFGDSESGQPYLGVIGPFKKDYSSAKIPIFRNFS